MDCAVQSLERWVGGGTGLHCAYDFFVEKVGGWSWKPLLRKSCILLEHIFALGLFAHGKFLTRD